MKTLQECKDEVARKYGFECWKDVLYTIHKRAYTSTFAFADEAAELYAAQFHKQETAEPEFDRFLPSVPKPKQKNVERLIDKVGKVRVQDTQEPAQFFSDLITYIESRPHDDCEDTINEIKERLKKNWKPIVICKINK